MEKKALVWYVDEAPEKLERSKQSHAEAEFSIAFRRTSQLVSRQPFV